MNRLTLFAAGLLLAGAVAADEIEEQIDLGREAYRSQDYKVAIDELNYAVAQIQELLNAQNANLLPEPLDGWTASEVENNSGAMGMAVLGGGTLMSREYQRDNQRVSIMLTAGSPMMSAMLTMMNNPMLMASDPTMKPYRFKRIKGMKQTSESEVEVTLALAGQVLIQVGARGGDDNDAAATSYLEALDFDRIEAALLP
jgi:hypothetical protein